MGFRNARGRKAQGEIITGGPAPESRPPPLSRRGKRKEKGGGKKKARGLRKSNVRGRS